MDDYKQVVTVRSGEIGPCAICGKGIKSRGIDRSEYWLDDQMNHMLEHGAKLLHVGQETVSGADGNPWQTTGAVFGVPA